MTVDQYKTHGFEGSLEEPDWPRLTLAEVDRLLRGYPIAGGAIELLSYSPRPFSAASVVATPTGSLFVKRHHRSVRNREGLLEEHRLISYLHAQRQQGKPLVQPVLPNENGDTVTTENEWTYEVHSLASGHDLYEQAISWTPFLNSAHARSAGLSLAKLHQALADYDAPARKAQQLVTSFTIFAGNHAGGNPVSRMEDYLAKRPHLRKYAEQRKWRNSFDELLLPLYSELQPWLKDLKPLWTHNDLHSSNLMWSDESKTAEISGIIDFGLADRTNAVHDLATTIERNIVEWLRMDDPRVDVVRFDHLDALLAGYEELSFLSYNEARALAAMLPLVHCEFALSETDYFLSILHSEEKAYLGYEGYFLAHAEWFHSTQGRRLLQHLERWAESHARKQVNV